mmetsp:Transcript_26035/g.72638  ORF Transcript_26035/g.72638 Transcript_26035/m.72638 type:complete len:291 (+) Transcript_26035:3674-4546(+)
MSKLSNLMTAKTMRISTVTTTMTLEPSATPTNHLSRRWKMLQVRSMHMTIHSGVLMGLPKQLRQHQSHKPMMRTTTLGTLATFHLEACKHPNGTTPLPMKTQKIYALPMKPLPERLRILKRQPMVIITPTTTTTMTTILATLIALRISSMMIDKVPRMPLNRQIRRHLLMMARMMISGISVPSRQTTQKWCQRMEKPKTSLRLKHRQGLHNRMKFATVAMTATTTMMMMMMISATLGISPRTSRRRRSRTMLQMPMMTLETSMRQRQQRRNQVSLRTMTSEISGISTKRR